jgi:8-oxo-dGTP pyrophosphatase MutT (NUDIX family)
VNFSDIVTSLEAALKGDLPGLSAQVLMAPRPARGWPNDFDPAQARHAAGLLLVFPRDGLAQVLLTVRAAALGRHGGQVALPGGALEPGESVERAAMREAHEEVGLTLDAVRPLGSLTPLDVPVSGFRLHPVVAAAGRLPVLRPADGEVARILEVPLTHLLDPRSLAWRTRWREGLEMEVPVFLVEGVEVWGATAMILAEFLTLLGWRGPRDGTPGGDKVI